MTNQYQYIYLHGFASSPQSAKVQYLREQLGQFDIDLAVPDLNQGDFSHLTITRQLTQVASLFSDRPVVLIGSSLGGLTAAWLGEKYPQVSRMILLAPAFGFLSYWLGRMTPEQLKAWQENGYIEVYHYGAERSLPLHYGFVEDARQYENISFSRQIPALICHGRHDQVIPIAASQEFCQRHPWAELIEYDSDHTLMDVISEIWQRSQQFLQLAKN